MTPEPGSNAVPGTTLFGTIEIAEADVKTLNSAALVERLVDQGASRLTAERMVELERGSDEPGRARPHTNARR
jgi:hypothetical protein